MVLSSTRMLPTLLAVNWVTLVLSHTLHLPIVAETVISGLMGFCVVIMYTGAWTVASVIHNHSPLFSVTLAMPSP